MGFWIPALLVGGVGASHHYASRELDYITKELEQPVLGFWTGLALGLTGGIWAGCSFGNVFNTVFCKWFPSLVAHLFRAKVSRALPNESDSDARGAVQPASTSAQ